MSINKNAYEGHENLSVTVNSCLVLSKKKLRLCIHFIYASICLSIYELHGSLLSLFTVEHKTSTPGYYPTLSTSPSLLKRFSNCSKISVGKTLRFKAPVCFKERNSKVCGNSRVEDGEECDPGLLHINDDPCCSSDCKFRQDAQCRYEIQKMDTFFQYSLKQHINWLTLRCQKIFVVLVWIPRLCFLHSDRNSPCCRNCKFEKAGKRCQEPISATCKGISSCTGEHLLLVLHKNCSD